MRTASILLALVVGLGFVREAGAQSDEETLHDWRITVGDYSFGFTDGLDHLMYVTEWSFIWLGPLGTYRSPFTAPQGLVGCCVLAVGMLALVTVATFRWKRKRA